MEVIRNVPFVELDDGVNMWYEVHGNENGKTILLYHGWGASTAFWSEQIPLLAELGYRVISLDSRGHGKSDKPRKGYTLDQLRKDFIIFQKELGLDTWAVIGHSAGGGVAQVTYHDYPNQTQALVLIDTSYTVVKTFEQKLFWKLLPTPLTITLTPLLRWSLRTISTMGVPFIASIMNKPVKTVESWVKALNSIPPHVIIEEIKQIVNYNLEEKLKEINVPVCLICGTLDIVTPLSDMREMQVRIPDSRLCMIKNAGHFALITQSEQVNRCLKLFLEEKYPPS